MFPKVNQKQSFPELEEKVLAFWKENDTFQKSIDQRPAENPYRFYDGPPFITGTPHYGSLLSSIIKDIIPRYQTMQWKRVERKWGWDCHGLPIEEKVQKKLGLAGSKDIEKVGIKKFIEECYTYTRETSAEWDWYIDHIGRWVDMENAYKTMDQDYMESVMWVFKSMWDKGMIYKGRRVSLYSWKLSTPISNFEVAMDDSYEEVSDPAITVMFPLSEDHKHVKTGDNLLAWTTTPWTIPCHMAIAVNPKLAYSRVKSRMYIKDWKLISIWKNPGLSETKEDWSSVQAWNKDGYFIVATARVETVFKWKEYEILESFMGDDLLGLRYEAPFKYYQWTVDPEKNHRVLDADFVTDTDGTGIAHEAPEFWDVDFQLAKEKWVHISSALDNEGKYTEEISDYEGMHYQEANTVISEKLKEMGVLFKKESINHRVAMCPRSGTPLIYKAQDSWFINIQDMKDKLIAENEGINWQPNHLKHGQFLKSMESAPDWCISRTRYWGTPMPIWKDSKENMSVFGSKKEIFEANKPFGQLEEKDWKYYFTWGEFDGKELDLHRPFIDNVLTVNSENFIAKKVLWIHGCWSSIEKDSWKKRVEEFKKNWIELESIQFDQSNDPTYESWEETFKTINFDEYDAVYTSSLWWLMTTRYITENNIKLKRLVMAVPGMSNNTIAWRKPNVQNIHDNTEKHNLENLVSERIVLTAYDDDIVSAENAEIFAEKTGSKCIKFADWWHSLTGHLEALIWIVKHGEPMQRTPEVLDVWMDSGSMPYAQMHYPFENNQAMESSYPADFIVEYIGQVRAWFYVMHVVGVALFDKRSFTNVITTGIVMGSDGRKMSKSYGNYPDPKVTIQKYGADAIRFYMANSPLLSGWNMDFKEAWILEVIKKVILPLWNTYSFFTTYANIDGYTPSETKSEKQNPLDNWMLSETHKLIADVQAGMDSYEITDATRPIVKFMDNLTNWYIRRSRKRFWKSENDGDKMQAYDTLYEVLTTLTQVMAPFTPFVTEHIYKNLTGDDKVNTGEGGRGGNLGWSVHLTDFPVSEDRLINPELNESMDLCQKIINLGLSLRTAQKMRVRQPLQSVSTGIDFSDYYKDIIKEELNVKEVLTVDSSSIASKICKPNGRLIGPKFGKDVKFIIQQAKAGNFTEIDENTVKVWDFTLEWDEFEMAYITEWESDNIESGFGMVISMDLELTEELKLEWHARDLVRHIQEARKEAGYQVDDRISINIIVENFEAISASYDIASETLSTLDTSLTAWDIEKEIELWDTKAKIILKK